MFDSRSILKYLPESLRDRSERTAFCALAACISVVLVSIAASQILLAVAIAGLVWMLRKHKDFIPMRMRILLPLLVFMVWTLIAAFASSNVILGLGISKKFYLYLLVPIVPLIVRGNDRVKWIYKAIFLFAIISSLRGLAQFAANPHRDPLHRISGFMSQWMTYSGLLMLALVLLTAYGLSTGIRNHKWIIPVAACIVLALLLSQTRNAWLGAIAGVAILVLIWRPRAFIILVPAVLICYAASPGAIKQRVKSIYNTTDPRIHIWFTAMHMIQDNPWFGVGPKNVKWEAPKYRDEKEFPDWLKRSVKLVSNPLKYQEEENELPDWTFQHMHNNFLQIAAETGIPGLLIWVWFMGRIGWDALACYRFAKSRSFPYDEELRKEALMASSAALAAWVALMAAGMFEYNFGDSEVLMLFLFIMSAPYAFTGLRVNALTNQKPQTRKPANRYENRDSWNAGHTG